MASAASARCAPEPRLATGPQAQPEVLPWPFLAPTARNSGILSGPPAGPAGPNEALRVRPPSSGNCYGSFNEARKRAIVALRAFRDASAAWGWGQTHSSTDSPVAQVIKVRLWAVAEPPPPAEMALQYLLTEPWVIGALTWVGFVATFVALVVAIVQISRARSAAEAAADATGKLSAAVHSRERLLELSAALGHLDSGRTHIAQRDYSKAVVFLELARRECVQVHELLERGSVKTQLYKGNLEQYSLSAISALAERAVAALVPR